MTGGRVSADVGEDVHAVPSEGGSLLHLVHEFVQAYKKLRRDGGVGVEDAEVDCHAKALKSIFCTVVKLLIFDLK